MISLDEILKRIDYLPPFPAAVAKILELLDDPSATADSIADAIRLDQATATNILRLSNSSWFSLRRTVTSIRDALVFVGLGRFREILVLSATRGYFENKAEGYEMKRGELWRQSMASSIIAEALCEHITVEHIEQIFITSLLHDVGKLVLSEFVHDSWASIFKLVDQDKKTFLEAEKDVIGMDHAELGSRILTMWKFDPEIVSAVEKHHHPSEDEDTALENIVRLADVLVMMMGFGTTVDGLAYHGYEDIVKRYSISQDALDHIMGDSLERIKRIEREFGLSGV